MADKVKPEIHFEWPTHIAKVPGCPLREAVPVNGVIFRRLNGTPDDWQSYKEQGKTVSQAKLCQSTSLSCYTDLDALRAMMAVHESWSTQKIVKATLRDEHGVIKQTGNDINHHSLWLRRKYHEICVQLFVEVDE